MTLLEIIREFSRRTGLNIPQSAASSGDDNTVQLIGLLNEVLEDLEERKAWSFLTSEAVFEATGSVDQGKITDLAVGFVKLINQSVMYNRTTGQVIRGPIPEEVWQYAETGLHPMAETGFRFLGTHLYLKPPPAMGDIIAFEYKSDITVYDPVTDTFKRYFTLDTDTCLYPDKIMINGLRWTWKREKGLRYADNLSAYETMIANLSGSDGGNPTISLSGGEVSGPGILVPEGNWVTK